MGVQTIPNLVILSHALLSQAMQIRLSEKIQLFSYLMCCNDRAIYNHVEYVAFQHDFCALDTTTAAFENNWAGDCRGQASRQVASANWTVLHWYKIHIFEPNQRTKKMTERFLGQSRLPSDGMYVGAYYVACMAHSLDVSEMRCVPDNDVFVFYNFASQEVVYVLLHLLWKTPYDTFRKTIIQLVTMILQDPHISDAET